MTIFGQGFESPVAVTLGNNPAIGQLVLSVTGTEVVFQTVGIPLSTCPASGVVVAQGVSVTNINTGDTATASNLAFSYQVPLPQIGGINPTGGASGSVATISGVNFASSVQVLFGDPTNGSAAVITSHSPSAITIQVPPAPPGFTFTTVQCDDNGDGVFGTRTVATPINVTVRNLDGTGCVTTLSNAFLLSPPSNTCVEPAPPPAGPVPGH